MPRYFFNVEDGKSLPDHDGCVLPHVDAAQRHAFLYAGQLIQDADKSFIGTEWRMDVTDESGLTLFTLFFFVSLAPAMTPAPA